MPKVLFAAAEASPLAKVGGLGDVAGSLPKALHALGVDIRVVIPKYLKIETPSKLPGSSVPIYYVSSKKYFDRDEIYGYPDDPERFAFFSRALLDLAKEENFEPDIVHINDYHTGLVPTLLKTVYAKDAFFAQTRTVLSLHNIGNRVFAPVSALTASGLEIGSTRNLEWDGRDGNLDFLLQGVSEADSIVAVSPTYAKEILTAEQGAGLEGKLEERQDRLRGILNGIDTEVYDPETDAHLGTNYSAKNLSPRTKNKESLVKELKFSHPEWPLFGLVGRLVEQKGIDLVVAAMAEISKLPLNLVILGLGDKNYERELAKLDQEDNNLVVKLEFNEGFARKIYAGSDFFLIPSLYEPSGLTQMIAMRYGSVPLVRKTGGLADTVFEGQTGLLFENYRESEFLVAVKRALEIYSDKTKLNLLQRNGMREDFSWVKSAKEYAKLYEEVRKLPKNYES